jgi:prepilin-type processing-associated H-X9-DG protein
LPYVEQDNLFRQIDPTNYKVQPTTVAPSGSNDWVHVTNTYGLSRNRVKTFECPSDNASDVDSSGGIYAWVQISNQGAFTLTYYTAASLQAAGGYFGTTNYVPVAGTIGRWTPVAAGSVTQPFYAAHEGVFVDENVNPVASVIDGMSNTAFFGEYIGAFANGNNGARIRSMSWFGAGGFPTYWSIVDMSDLANGRFSYGSLHTGICNFAFGDGSVRAIRKPMTLPASAAEIGNRTNVNWDALQRFSGMRDGDVTVDGAIN